MPLRILPCFRRLTATSYDILVALRRNLCETTSSIERTPRFYAGFYVVQWFVQYDMACNKMLAWEVLTKPWRPIVYLLPLQK